MNWPEESLHLKAESEFHMLDSHMVDPTTILSDTACAPKLCPSNVKEVLPD